MSAHGPDAVLGAVVMGWALSFVKDVAAKQDGTFKGHDERGGLASGMVTVAAWSKGLNEEQMATIHKT